LIDFEPLWELKGLTLELFWHPVASFRYLGATRGNCNISMRILQFSALWGTLGRHFCTKFQENVLGGTHEAIFSDFFAILGAKGCILGPEHLGQRLRGRSVGAPWALPGVSVGAPWALPGSTL